MKHVGIGYFTALNTGNAPEQFTRMTNTDLGLDDQLVRQKTGIRTRLIAHPQETIASLTHTTLQQMLKRAKLEPDKLGGIVLATCYPGDPRRVAEEVVEQSGMDYEALGIDRACVGFVAATEIAQDRVLHTGLPYAVIATEKLSDMINWEHQGHIQDDRAENERRARGKGSKIFGDGSAGALVTPPDMRSSYELLDVFSSSVLFQPNRIILQPVEKSTDPWGNVREEETECIHLPDKAGALLKRDGTTIILQAVRASIQRAFDKGYLLGKNLPEHIVPHQANGSMINNIDQVIQQYLAEINETGMTTPVKVWNRIAHMGNVSAACLPSVMALASRTIHPGERVGMGSVGAGSPGFDATKLEMGGAMLRRSEPV